VEAMIAASSAIEGQAVMDEQQNLQEEYAGALVEHISKADEATLNHAYELGRKILGDGFGVLDQVMLHNEALGRIVVAGSLPEVRKNLDRASEFLAESLSAFETSLRGYREAKSHLAELNGTLQELYELAGGLNRCRTEAEVARFAIERILKIPRVRDGWIELHGTNGINTSELRDHKPRAEGLAAGTEYQHDEAPDGLRQEVTSVPLIVEGKPVGTLNLRGSGPSGAFSENERKTIVNIANQISNALERARLYELLERKVQQRTGDLVKAAKVKDEFLAMVSHELRTPLTSINAAIELLVAEKLGSIAPDARKLVELAQSNGARLLRIVNDLIDVTRISSGTLDLKIQRVEIEPMLAQVVDSKLIGPEFKGVRIALVNRAEGTFVEGDAGRLQQVLDNLISNAVKFSESNCSLEIVIDHHNDNVRVSITDNGIGISEEFHASVFAPFTQADSSSTRKVGGIGLGLHIARAIVEAHNGKIGFTSKPGKGSTFYFELPISF
jgi:signal transduction histidine kinase